MDTKPNGYPDTYPDFNVNSNTGSIGYGLKYAHFHGFTCYDANCTGRHSLGNTDAHPGTDTNDLLASGEVQGEWASAAPEIEMIICGMALGVLVFCAGLAIGLMLGVR